MGIGFTLPFAKSTGSLGYFAVTNNEVSAVRENIKSLLLTNWGERPMHYYLGANLREFLFEQIDLEELRSKIEDRIVSQIATWLPFVSLDKIVVLLAEDGGGVPENQVRILLEFRITSRPDISERLDLFVVP